MYIAIYHNQDVHHEMLGCLIEYCISKGYKADIYAKDLFGEDEKGKAWLQWYNYFFRNIKNIKWSNREILIETISYDVILLVTDDNVYYANYVPEKYYKKTFCIDHWVECRNTLKHHISVRPYEKKPELPVAYPVYNIIGLKRKKEVMKRDRIQLFFIGRFNAPTSHNLLLFENLQNMDIHYINWEIGDRCKYLKYMPNLYLHPKLSTIELMQLLSTGHYIFVEPSYIEGYNGNKLSSLIPLAISTLCQVIMPDSWNETLNLTSPMTYNDKGYVSPKGQIQLNLKQFEEMLPVIEAEKQRLIKGRDETFNKVIEAVLEDNRDA